jgi:ATP-dependent DNA helicase RecG
MNRTNDNNNGEVSGVTAQMKKILDHIKENGHITDQEIQDLLCLKKTRTFTLTKQMRDEGLIKVVGRGNDKKYIKP